MKKTLIISLFALLAWTADAQKFGYIDSQEILDKMGEYKQAQQDLDKAALSWQKEVEALQKTVVQKRLALEAEKVLFTEDMKKQKEAEIKAEEDKVREQQNKIFGVDGLLFRKRQELMKPIQDKIYVASQKVAKAKKLAFIFDKSGDLVMIFADPTHDYTDYVLEAMGLSEKKDPKTDDKK
jgi:outer membrane protein